MTLDGVIARWSRGWRGPAAAAFVAFVAGLPGLLAMPPLDRDESRFAQATAQMLESGDYTVIRFQEQPRFKKPVGIHWMQALTVQSLSSPEARDIWAYRLPSLLGAMLAAAACAWGAAAFFGGPAGLVAGALLGGTLLLSTEAFIAKTDAMLAGCITLAMAALGRLYAAARDGPPAGKRTEPLFWAGLSLGALVKGPVAPLVIGLALIALALSDRRPGWIARLRWWWGLIAFAAVVGPWSGAVTVATDGAFWSTAIGSDLAPKLAGGQESHGAPPGYHLLLTPILTFPMTALLAAAAVTAWTRRREPGIRFALCWLIPGFLMFELTPTKLPHYPLPTYGAIAWLCAAALTQPIGRGARWTGAGLAGLVGLVLAVAVFYLLSLYGEASDAWAAGLTAVLLAAAGLAAGWLLLRDRPRDAAALSLALAIAGHGALAALFAPRLDPLWISARMERALAQLQLLPRQGVAEAPIAVAGYAEPSLVFALGTATVIEGASEAAQAVAEGRPAIVEDAEARAFAEAVSARGVEARELARVSGLNYSKGDETTLRVYMAR